MVMFFINMEIKRYLLISGYLGVPENEVVRAAGTEAGAHTGGQMRKGCNLRNCFEQNKPSDVKWFVSLLGTQSKPVHSLLGSTSSAWDTH